MNGIYSSIHEKYYEKTLPIFVLSFATLHSIAQCGKVAIYFSGKAKFFDTAGKVVQNTEEKIILKVSRTEIILAHNDIDDDTMKAEITDRK